MRLKLTIEAIEAIDMIAREGSFAAAAKALHKVPSALTYTIKKLEDDLNIAIFDRSGHRPILTETGQALLKEGRHILNATYNLESHLNNIAQGYESEIRIAIDALINNDEVLLDILKTFYACGFGTQVKITREVFGGNWDALLCDRADISIGAPGDAPPGAVFETSFMGDLNFSFAIAPHHPLAQIQHPLTDDDISQYRAIVVADSSRQTPARSVGILSGQNQLVVADMQAKINAQISGIGVGYLPDRLAEKYVKSGALIIKPVENIRQIIPSYLAWKKKPKKMMGRSQKWLLDAFKSLSLDDLFI